MKEKDTSKTVCLIRSDQLNSTVGSLAVSKFRWAINLAVRGQPRGVCVCVGGGRQRLSVCSLSILSVCY